MTSQLFLIQNEGYSEKESFKRKIGHRKLPILETKSSKAKVLKENWGSGLPEPFLQAFEVIGSIGNVIIHNNKKMNKKNKNFLLKSIFYFPFSFFIVILLVKGDQTVSKIVSKSKKFYFYLI